MNIVELEDRIAELEKQQAEISEEKARLESEREHAEKTIRVTEYLHANHSEYAEWEFGEEGPLFAPEVHNKLHYRLYEVAFDLEIDVTTGEYKILEVREGNQVLRPVDD